MEKKPSRATVGQMAELCAAKELVKNGFSDEKGKYLCKWGLLK